MDDMTALERLIASAATRAVGPPRPVDAMAVVRSAKAASEARWSLLDRWFPGRRSTRPEGGFSMFSALKFVAAAAIVALFGGFLLTGILTTPQEGEVLPAAVTESPSPRTTEAFLSGMVTEEVGSGVYRVIDDGVRDLTSENNREIVAGHDGGLWLVRLNRFLRLGSDAAHEWAARKPEWIRDFEVAPDGTVWTMQEDAIQSFDGEQWTTHHTRGRVGLTSDGTVWAVWADPEAPESMAFGYLGADGWQSVGEWPDMDSCSKGARCAFLVSDQGGVWAVLGKVSNLQHFVDGAWRTYDGVDGPGGSIRDAAVGADGTLWGSTRNGFFRFDGTEWTTYEWHDGTLADVFPADVFGWGEFHVAPDGSLWVAPQPGKCGPDRCSCDHGVTRFDGTSWGRYLRDLCVEAFDIRADGSVWLLASEAMLTTFDPEQQEWVFAGDATWDLYVVTPEAVAPSE